ncbi:hypothetical protein AYI69_g781 [Smittium culicis]|uniref:Uncharacterized protein n=1 Tax=Smittium culicis TaxID=133412 RepID=A0A1R1YS18_9FUNG|nr:hypothetical protein AYI69_g781 [Smittium culicis]
MSEIKKRGGGGILNIENSLPLSLDAGVVSFFAPREKKFLTLIGCLADFGLAIISLIGLLSSFLLFDWVIVPAIVISFSISEAPALPEFNSLPIFSRPFSPRLLFFCWWFVLAL